MTDNPRGRVFRSTRRRIFSPALAGGAAAVGAGFEAARARNVSAQQTNSPFVGAWLGNFSRSDGQMIIILLTAHENGSLVTSSSDHLADSTSHGTWVDLGNNQYAYSQVRMNIDSAGNYTGIRTIDADVTVDPTGNTWTSTTKISYYDTGGNFIQTITSSGTGTRVPLTRTSDTRPGAFTLPPSGN